jgi:hypothetical protein
VALFTCLLWLFLVIPTDFGFARIGEKYQLELGTPTGDEALSVEETDRGAGCKILNTTTDSTSTMSEVKKGVDQSAAKEKSDVRIEVVSEVALVEQKEEVKHPTATTPHIAQTPLSSPRTSPETQSVVFFWKTDQGSVESRVAKVKGDGDVLEITSEDRKLPIFGSQLVLVIAPLPPGSDIQKLTKERVDLASSRYDSAEKIDELKTLLADGRAKWNTIKASPEAPVITSTQPDSLPELDVTTAAGVEEPTLVLAKDETKPTTGWESWISWAKSFTGKALGR